MAWRRVVHAGTELTASLQTLLTFATGLTTGGAVLRSFSVANDDSSAHLVKVYLIASGGAAAPSNLIFEETVPANTTVTPMRGPWQGNDGAFVQAISDLADSNVGVRLTVAEEFL